MKNRLTALLVAAVLSVVGGVSLTLPHASAAGCVAAPITDPMTVTLTNSAGDNTYEAWEQAEVRFSGSISDGHCAGDSFTFDIPQEFAAQSGSYELKDADGVVAGTMVVTGDRVAGWKVTVTVNDYVETHQNVKVHGYFVVRLNETYSPSEQWSSEWNVNGETTVIPLEMEPCPNCGDLPTDASKFANYNPDSETIDAVVVLPTSKDADQLYTIVDRITSPGQVFNCDAPVTVLAFTGLTPWGNVDPAKVTVANGVATTVECVADSHYSVTWRSTVAGESARVDFPLAVTDDSLRTWTDEGEVTTGGETFTAPATAYSYAAGGGAEGDTPTPTPTPIETPTPDVTPTETPEPTATPSVTPEESVTAESTWTPVPSRPGLPWSGN